MNNAIPSWDQIKGGLDRLLIALFAVAIGKGWITASDAANYIAAILAVGAVIYGFWVNRQKALLQSAATVPAGPGKKTVIITSSELASSTPESNIVSSDKVKTVEVKK